MYSCSADIPKPNEPYLSPLPEPLSILCKQSSDREEVGRAKSVSLVFTHLVPASFKVAIKIYIARLRSLRKLMPRTTYIWHPAEKRNCLCFILIVCSPPPPPKDLSPCPSQATLVTIWSYKIVSLQLKTMFSFIFGRDKVCSNQIILIKLS